MRRVLDWLDWFSGYDRAAYRALLLVALMISAVIVGELLVDRLFPPGQGICEHYPDSRYCQGEPLSIPTLTPAEIDRIVQDILREKTR